MEPREIDRRSEARRAGADDDAIVPSRCRPQVNVYTFRYADLSCRRSGVNGLIASQALALNLTLVTNNERDFALIPGLAIENWMI